MFFMYKWAIAALNSSQCDTLKNDSDNMQLIALRKLSNIAARCSWSHRIVELL